MKEGRHSACVKKEDSLPLFAESLPYEIEHSREGLSGIDRIEENGLSPGKQEDGLRHGGGGKGVTLAHVTVEALDEYTSIFRKTQPFWGK